MRADLYLFQKGYVKSRQKAKSLIEEGHVKINGMTVNKPSIDIPDIDNLVEIEDSCPYVSRGGLKLEKAIKRFNISLENKIVLDIGASTGGFTDCSLQNGARKVYSLDVGENQLHDSLRNNDKVVSLEKINFRTINTKTVFGGKNEKLFF
jgi:23S rRNA (cytidine1920-2'-O)/16S rRNA (cytidine1409-2'-O)-methyltransferase